MRAVGSKGHRDGYKPRTLRTRVGKLNVLVPQDCSRTRPAKSYQEGDFMRSATARIGECRTLKSSVT